MPSPLELAQFQQELLAELEKPVESYYETLERPRVTSLPGLIQSLSDRLVQARELAALKRELRRVLMLSYQVAGALGAGGAAMDDRQNREVMRRYAEAERYLDGYVNDLPKMSRTEALARIAKYLPPVVQAFSASAASDLPQLPIMPGDSRLECSRKIRACRCYLDIQRVGPNDWDVRWVQTAAESCVDCEALGRAWNPLRIRRGRIVAENRPAPPPAEKQISVTQKSLSHTGAMIALYPPVTLASDLERLTLGVLPTAEQADDLHLTLLFLGEAADLGDRTEALRATIETFAAAFDPIRAQLNGTARFDSAAAEEGTPFVALVDSPQLPAFRQALFEAAVMLGIQPMANHGFIPHLTLAYMPTGQATPTLFLPESEVTFEKLSLVVGDARFDFPFRVSQLALI